MRNSKKKNPLTFMSVIEKKLSSMFKNLHQISQEEKEQIIQAPTIPQKEVKDSEIKDEKSVEKIKQEKKTKKKVNKALKLNRKYQKIDKIPNEIKQQSTEKKIKQPLSSYMHFFHDHKALLTEKYPNRNFIELNKIAAALWKQLTQQEKSIYIQRFNEQKKKYLQQMKEAIEKKEKNEKLTNGAQDQLEDDDALMI